jgi:hypothetical protein
VRFEIVTRTACGRSGIAQAGCGLPLAWGVGAGAVPAGGGDGGVRGGGFARAGSAGGGAGLGGGAGTGARIGARIAGGGSRSIQQSERIGRASAADAAASRAAISGSRNRYSSCERNPIASGTSGSS